MEPIPGIVKRATNLTKLLVDPREDPGGMILQDGHSMKVTPSDLLLYL